MDKNLSINKEIISKILKEETNSKIPRMDRIRDNNPDLFKETSGKPDKKTAGILLDWNNEIVKYNPDIVDKARAEIRNYSGIIDLAINSSAENINLLFPSIKELKYKSFSKLLTFITKESNSKLLQRMNNLKLLVVMYEKERSEKNKKALFEYILSEIFQQKAFLIIFEKNIKDFGYEYFPLALILYDVPAETEQKLNIIKKLKK